MSADVEVVQRRTTRRRWTRSIRTGMAASAELVREHAKDTIRLRFVEDPVKGGVDAERLKVDMEVLKTM